MTLPPAFDLAGRTALVSGTGSPAEIGFAAAKALGELGATVLITATTSRIFDRAENLAALGISAMGFVARLNSEREVAALMHQVRKSHPAPDIVVNNAGMVSSTEGHMESGDITMDPEEWSGGLERNLTTAFLLTRATIPAMRAAGWGRVINVSSVSGAVMASRADVAYAASKAGLIGLTRAVAVDEARFGITANAVAPGWISTASQLESERAEGKLVPLRRSGTAEEVAAAIAWLATPGAAYVTGQTLVVDGGNAIAEQRSG